ncbi:MAG TPA: ATP-binding protein, partial [Verrucomicrobiae bacterium]|nr:ATP-binding protein [Verrucomicrobiae bacterium]
PFEVAAFRETIRECIEQVTRDAQFRTAQAELLASEARYRNLFSAMHEGFALLSPRGGTYRIEELNAAFGRIAGTSPDALRGADFASLFPLEPEYWREKFATVTGAGGRATVDYYSLTFRRQFEGEVYAPAPGELAVILWDVTETRIFQEEREKAQRLESLGTLAGGIAHDFNNILTAIIGNISLARRQVGEEHKAAQRLVRCEEALNRATDLTRQLLTFARGGEPQKGIVEPEELLREAAVLALSGSNCTARFDISPDTWALWADKGQIHQVITNLIANAAQAMPEGGIVSISACNEEVTPPHGETERFVKVVVEDQGCGIGEPDLQRIFDPYFSTKPTGTGLGLTTAFSIVKRHGGSLRVTSTIGVGTRFEIRLPAAGEGKREEDAAAGTCTTAGSGCILVMDDEEMVRCLAVAMLEELGYAATSCSDGAEAVALYMERAERGRPFDAVLLDLTVPGGMGGKEAAARIREFDRCARLIISSGYSHEVLGEDAGSMFAGAVKKPYNVAQLAAALEVVLRRSPEVG